MAWIWVAALLLASCVRPADPPRRPNVVLISVDTLRADRLGAYGYRLPTSPTFDRLAARGVRFHDATVPWPKTWPAMASMLTGLYPATNGVRRFPRRPLPSEHETLAEILGSAGYATAAVVANVNVGRGFAFDQGFDTFVESWAEEARRQTGTPDFENAPGRVKQYTNATIVTDEAIELLGPLADDAPFFLWLHYIDPHGPYVPPGEYEELWRGQYPSRRVSILELPKYQRQQRKGGQTIANIYHYEAQYDREIRYFDDQLARLLGALEEKELTDDTLIVFTADHGESLSEHGYYLRHGGTPYQPNAWVPFVLVLPGRLPAGRVIEAPVGLIDLTPTILDLVGVPAPERVQGRSLVPTIDSGAAPPEYVFLESGEIPPTQLAVRKGKWKLARLRAPQDRAQLGREELELYDLEADPGETNNVLAENPEVAEELGRALAAWRRSTPSYDGRETLSTDAIDEDTKQMLRALGYVD